MSKKTIKNKIGYCTNKKLHIKKNPNKGHYVYICKVNNDGTCDVNTITSLTDKKTGKYSKSKIKMIKDGVIYPIPKNDANFSRWSGFDMRQIKGVKVSDIQDVGKRYVKNRHKFYVGKFSK